VTAAQVIARSLQDIGIDAHVRTYDFGAWYARLQRGEFDLSLGWSNEGATPYVFYRWLMSQRTVVPIGQLAEGNWHRFGSAEADTLLARMEREGGEQAQHDIVRDLERVFSEQAPALPLYANPSWAEYNTSRFSGFPSAENPYADPSPNKEDRGETLLVLTTVTPS
jgi:peptide/nickel transport system substrate-binding protein